RAAQLLILLAQASLLGFERHILWPEQLDMDLRVPVEDLVALFGQLRAKPMSDIGLGKLELARLELRLNVLHKMQVGLLRLRIVCVASHGDVAFRGLLVDGGAQLAPIQQPLFERGGGAARLRAGFELVEERSNPAPFTQVNGLWHKAARL